MDGTIRTVSCQFRKPNIKGQTITAHGRISAIRTEGDEVVAELDVWTEDQDGSKLAPGTASVSVPA